MRLQNPSGSGLAIGEADNRYLRLAGGTMTGELNALAGLNTVRPYSSGLVPAGLSDPAPAFPFETQWNNAGKNWTAVRVSVTDTASGSSSKIADFQVSGVSCFSFYKTGNLGIRTAGWGEFLFTQHDTYGFGIKSPNGNWVFAAQNDGGLAALNLFSASTGRIGFKSTSFHSGAVWQFQSVGFERVSDTELKVTDSSSNLADWKARRGSLSEYLDVAEMSAPAAPAANTARLYVEDDGSGKTRLMVLFPTGAAQVLATEP